MKKVKTVKYIKEVLANYDGICVRDDEDNKGYFVSCLDQGIQEYFCDRKELLAWATFTFWNRDMHRAGC